jgi:hypothetical protein
MVPIIAERLRQPSHLISMEAESGQQFDELTLLVGEVGNHRSGGRSQSTV